MEQAHVKSFWYAVQDAQHAGQVEFPPWSQPVINHSPSQLLPKAPPARPVDPAATKKDFLYYWYRPQGSFSSVVNRSYSRWPGPMPYERAHLTSPSASARVSHLPAQWWGYPLPEDGPGASLIARRLREEEVLHEVRRMRLTEHRTLCRERLLHRKQQRAMVEDLSGLSGSRDRGAINSGWSEAKSGGSDHGAVFLASGSARAFPTSGRPG